MGQGKTKREVLDIVRNKIQIEKKKKGRSIEQCKFNGEGWWVGFKHRHPDLTLRTSDALSYSRSNAVDEESITYYFNSLKKAFYDNNLMDKACYICNMDKTGMPLDHKQPKRVVIKKVYGLL